MTGGVAATGQVRPQPRREQLRDRTTLLVGDIVALLRAGNRQDLVERLAIEARRPAGERVGVVVAGEAKRGKSSLVNALLAQPNLSPVDADVATSAHIVFSHADTPYARVHLATAEEPVEIELDEVADWASVSGNPGNHRGVRSVEVGLDAPILQDLTLVDTPGVGGLELGHAAFTLQALGQADALLFVIDAGAPITAPELDFLRRAAERIDTVIIVLTKIDLYRGWQRILDDDRALLTQHAPRFAACPILPVSSLNAERAIALGHGPMARELRREAGLYDIESALAGHVVERSALLRLANLVRLCHYILGSVERTAVEKVVAARGDPELLKALEAEDARLKALGRDSAEWRSTLDTELRRVGLERDARLQRAAREILRRYAELAMQRRRAEELEDLGVQMLAECAALASRLAEDTQTAISGVAEEILGGIDRESALAAAMSVIAGGDVTATAWTNERGQPMSAMEQMSVLMSFSAGRGFFQAVPALIGATGGGGAAAAGGIFAAAALPMVAASLAAGAAFALLLNRGRRTMQRQADFRTWAQQQLVEVQHELQSSFALALLDVQNELRRALTRQIELRADEIAAAKQTYMRAVNEDASSRKRDAEAAAAELERLRALQRSTVELLGDIRQARVAPV